ncbi:aminoglycoside adenylyltransferase domain-containing protein [Streptomyces coeruleoprunus]|uniref:Aminoglycoside adenylyltransferase domain-containing protein n=1 Tax=Streptomyces coeruleoprunus TaxID=285563 RepID=A0ABV9X8L5_9ACTN
MRGRPPLIGLLDPPADRYLRACVEVLRRHRGTELIGAYLYGSGVIGTFLPGRSDVDVVAVVAGPLRRDTALALARQVTAVPRPYGVKGMDLAVVSATAAATRSPAPRCEMKLLTFWGEPRTADEEPEGDRRMVMHFACCLDHGIALTGPHPAQVFAPVAREAYLSALRAELAMRWLSPQYRVLNACRDWRYAAESVICSKTEGGRWARDRLPDPWLVDAALQWQTEGAGPVIDVVELEEFLRQMEDRLLAGQAEPPVPVATAPRTWTGAAR